MTTLLVENHCRLLFTECTAHCRDEYDAAIWDDSRRLARHIRFRQSKLPGSHHTIVGRLPLTADAITRGGEKCSLRQRRLKYSIVADAMSSLLPELHSFQKS